MVKISFDAGHGKHTPGKRAPSGVFEEREWFFNDKILRYCLDYLKDYEVSTLRVDDSTGEKDISLADRVKKINAWNPTAHFSFHNNAYQGKWGTHTGTEVYTSRNASRASESIANKLQKNIVKAIETRDRGHKKANFYIITYTKAPAVLIEFLFMDSSIDIKKLRSNSYLKKAGEAVAKTLVSHYKLKKKSAKKPENKANIENTGTYTVKKGDTLWAISQNHKMSVSELKELNGLKSNLIHPGQKLITKKKSTRTHTVKRGDTLWAISIKYKTTVDKIKKENGLKSNLIHPGDKLKV